MSAAKHYGLIIKEIREERALSINEISKIVGVSPKTWENWEKGKALITTRNLLKLQETMKFTLNRFNLVEREQIGC